MAHFKEHCEDCVREVGKPYKEVHKWLDEFAFEDGKINPEHRNRRHHKEALKECRELFGDSGVEAALIHIRKDMGGLPENSSDCIDFEFKQWAKLI